MIYVFDIDGTICTSVESDYKNAEPMYDRIEIINKLYEEGHRIIFCTARGMGRSQNSIAYARAAFRALTEDQLAKWGAKYHELFLGKPAGDIYIDDKGMRDLDFFKTMSDDRKYDITR